MFISMNMLEMIEKDVKNIIIILLISSFIFIYILYNSINIYNRLRKMLKSI